MTLLGFLLVSLNFVLHVWSPNFANNVNIETRGIRTSEEKYDDIIYK